MDDDELEIGVRKMDLTEGPIAKKLLSFALPIIIGNIILQLYNMDDAVVVGNFIGDEALAAVTVSNPIMFLFNALFMGLSTGANVLVSQYKGAKETKTLEKVINTAYTLCILVGVGITVIGLFFSRPLLLLLGTPQNILDDSVLYLNITLYGTISSIIYNIGNGVARGLGDSKWPLYALIMSSVINVALDLFLIGYLGMGVGISALTNLIACSLASVMIIVRFIKNRYGIKLSLISMIKPDKRLSGQIFNLGIPTAIQNAAMSLGAVIMQVFANNFGSDFIAANGILMRVDGFIMMPLFGMGMAITTFVGQNTGAGKPDRVREGIFKSLLISLIATVVLGVAMQFVGYYLVRMLTDKESIITMGLFGVRFIAYCYIFMAINQCLSGAMRGAGAAKAPALFSIISSAIRIPAAYFLAGLPFNRAVNDAVTAGTYLTAELARAAGVGLEYYRGIYYSMAINMAIGALLVFLYYKFANWHDMGVTDRA